MKVFLLQVSSKKVKKRASDVSPVQTGEVKNDVVLISFCLSFCFREAILWCGSHRIVIEMNAFRDLIENSVDCLI